MSWTDDEVMARWEKLYGIATPIAIGLADDASPVQRALAEEMIEIRRQRLTDLSWFMKCLNEYIARKANLEDQCTGHFWQSRFQSQALLDERALLTCMAYVDLNPIRAGIARSLEDSDYTSVQARINTTLGQLTLLPLVPFEDELDNNGTALPYYLRHYLELVDTTGRVIGGDKRGSISKDIEPILEKLGFDEATWWAAIKLYGRPMFQAVGPANKLRQAAKANHRCWYRGTSVCQLVFGPL